MIYKLVVPGPIEGVQEVRVLEWHGAPGRRFEPGELVVELETHKATIEVRANRPGVLRRVLCEEGGWSPVGSALALLSDHASEALPESPEALEQLPVEFEIG